MIRIDAVPHQYVDDIHVAQQRRIDQRPPAVEILGLRFFTAGEEPLDLRGVVAPDGVQQRVAAEQLDRGQGGRRRKQPRQDECNGQRQGSRRLS